MNAAQRTKQQQCCHMTFKRLVRHGVLPGTMTVYEMASQLTGREIRSLTWLRDYELNALRDILEGKGTRLANKCHELARAAGIEDLAAWMRDQAARRDGLRWMIGHTAETLPLPLQHQLAVLLSARRLNRPKKEEPRPMLALFDAENKDAKPAAVSTI